MPVPSKASRQIPDTPVAPHEKAPERRRKELIEAARTEFAEHGFGGARVQRIADRTNSNKALLYGYFGSKQGLYLAVLKGCTKTSADGSEGLNLHDLEPVAALETLVAFTFNYYVENPDFVAILSNENLLGARSLPAIRTDPRHERPRHRRPGRNHPAWPEFRPVSTQHRCR